MAHTDLRPHTDLAQEVSRWTQGEDLIATSSAGPSTGADTTASKRRRTTAKDMIEVTFTSPSAAFQRSLPRTLTTKDLYKVAFRGMRARHTNFLLVNAARRIAPSANKIESMAGTVTRGMTLTIEILLFPEGQRSYSDPDACLVKIFGNTEEEMLCAFWTSRWGASSMRLVTIKYWRFMIKQYPHMDVIRLDIWSNMRKGGDGYFIGNVNTTDTQLSHVLSTCTNPGSLGDEDAYNVAVNSRVTVLKMCVIAKKEKKILSKLEVLQQSFESLVNRVLAYSFMPHIGLVSISTNAKEVQSITHAVERFRNSVDGLEPDGDTALWDGLLLAKNRIVEYAAKFPAAKKRIICLSDGEDTTSTIRPAEVYSQLRKEKITVDSICIGNSENTDLKAISYLLGGYAFKPKDLTTALGLCEMETMLSLLERPEVVMRPWNGLGLQTHFESAKRNTPYTQLTKDVVPPRRQHDRLSDSVLELTTAMSARRSASSAMAGAATTRSNTRTTRLLSEMQVVAQNPSPQYDVYVSEVDMSFWKVVMAGPTDTPYEAGTFLLYLDSEHRSIASGSLTFTDNRDSANLVSRISSKGSLHHKNCSPECESTWKNLPQYLRSYALPASGDSLIYFANNWSYR